MGQEQSINKAEASNAMKTATNCVITVKEAPSPQNISDYSTNLIAEIEKLVTSDAKLEISPMLLQLLQNFIFSNEERVNSAIDAQKKICSNIQELYSMSDSIKMDINKKVAQLKSVYNFEVEKIKINKLNKDIVRCEEVLKDISEIIDSLKPKLHVENSK